MSDADGEHFPVLLNGETVPALEEGWRAVGLATDFPPFLLLELRHADGREAAWVLDEMLDVRAQSIASLSDADRQALGVLLEPRLRILFDEAVRAPHAAVPSTAHELEHLLDGTVSALVEVGAPLVPGLPRVMPVSAMDDEAVRHPVGTCPDAEGILHSFRSLNNGDGRRVPSPFDAGLVTMQERIVLPGAACFRYLDPNSGSVFYLTVPERHEPGGIALYLPDQGIVATDRADASATDPLLPLLSYYATHTERAVMLPEMQGLSGFEPPSAPVPPAVAPVPAEIEPAYGAGSEPAITRGSGHPVPPAVAPTSPDPADLPTAEKDGGYRPADNGPPDGAASGPTSYPPVEAPPADRPVPPPGFDPALAIDPASPARLPPRTEPTLGAPVRRPGELDRMSVLDAGFQDPFPPALVRDDPEGEERMAAAPAKQTSWWQRLFGLGR
ncbi:hypothetical protein [Rhizosaccharibacter radicis]|uniref:Uncharacterized protein n=1 Tax=Rhizosaccharibacter radicis TaxID=2782605 RepID=A0ABT1W305_9PROT|nr:hypothetical protein [Acetobacteraceae bacterium KSS12]